ncbi:MAG: translation elongation factor Ts [Defluviicoccus sp.]|nr:translation elongation factor Ts [Defluviicoccus sp.]
MAQITASLVKALRDKTGAGMMDCKKALTETGGEIDAAVDWLRKNGLAAAAKKAGRIAAEGLVAVATEGTEGAVIEINAETDFVGRNAEFQTFVQEVANIALGTGDSVEALGDAPMGEGTVASRLTDLIAKIGENMSLRRVERLSVANGAIGSYVHNSVAPGLGRIAVLVGLESAGASERLDGLARQLAMHVAAASPQWTAIDGIDPAALERERGVLSEQARASGRPENIVEKMVAGRLKKFYEDTVLLEQTFVIDGESKVSGVVEAVAGEIGTPVSVAGFRRFALGEGIEKQGGDFAAEVAATVGE